MFQVFADIGFAAGKQLNDLSLSKSHWFILYSYIKSESIVRLIEYDFICIIFFHLANLVKHSQIKPILETDT